MGVNKVFKKWVKTGKVLKKIFGCALIVISFLLSANALIASNYIDLDEYRYSGVNAYIAPYISKDVRLASIIERESKGLEFMVWSHERLELSRNLSEMLHKRINFSPFNGNLWSQLSYLQRDAGVSISERAWTIERASRLLRWNFNQRSKISRYCITEYAQFELVSPELCSSLISNLPKHWSDVQKSINANVRLQDLESVILLEQAKRNNGVDQ
ncbi:MAG: hypothetical protein ACI9OI_000718 [Chitinophagales bacterium]|jgi:hypothetical protein